MQILDEKQLQDVRARSYVRTGPDNGRLDAHDAGSVQDRAG